MKQFVDETLRVNETICRWNVVRWTDCHRRFSLIWELDCQNAFRFLDTKHAVVCGILLGVKLFLVLLCKGKFFRNVRCWACRCTMRLWEAVNQLSQAISIVVFLHMINIAVVTVACGRQCGSVLMLKCRRVDKTSLDNMYETFVDKPCIDEMWRQVCQAKMFLLVGVLNSIQNFALWLKNKFWENRECFSKLICKHPGYETLNQCNYINVCVLSIVPKKYVVCN